MGAVTLARTSLWFEFTFVRLQRAYPAQITMKVPHQKRLLNC